MERIGVVEISPEGADALRGLASTLARLSSEFESAAYVLERRVQALDEGLGIYATEINELVANLRVRVEPAQDALGLLGQQVLARASWVDTMVADGLFAQSTELDNLLATVRGVAPAPYLAASRFGAGVPAKQGDESRTSDTYEVTRPTGSPSLGGPKRVRLADGGTLIGSPLARGLRLNSDQGHAREGFMGDCGVVSCQNIARMAGKDVTEGDALDLATQYGLCEQDSDDAGENGGTLAWQRMELLHYMGIASHLDSCTLSTHIADLVGRGHGVVAAVDVEKFWPDSGCTGGHAVTITAVELDAAGAPRALYVCDSGSDGGDYARRVSVGFLGRALRHHVPLNVTDEPLW